MQKQKEGARGGTMGSPAFLDAVLEALRFGQGLELLQRVVLDLADALSRYAEGSADLLERARLFARQAEAELDHLPLPLRQRGQCVLDVLAPERKRCLLVRRLRGVVLDEVAELRVL